MKDVTPPGYVKDSFCSYCGIELPDISKYPRRCLTCGNYAWGNPIPVVVVLLPVEQDGKVGLLIQKRNIDPEKGNWALTGGYVNSGEDWRTAAARETMEELRLETDPNKFHLYDVVSGKDGATLLVICIYQDRISPDILSTFQPNEEVQAIDIMWEPKELAFGSHTKASNDLIRAYRNHL